MTLHRFSNRILKAWFIASFQNISTNVHLKQHNRNAIIHSVVNLDPKSIQCLNSKYFELAKTYRLHIYNLRELFDLTVYLYHRIAKKSYLRINDIVREYVCPEYSQFVATTTIPTPSRYNFLFYLFAELCRKQYCTLYSTGRRRTYYFSEPPPIFLFIFLVWERYIGYIGNYIWKERHLDNQLRDLPEKKRDIWFLEQTTISDPTNPIESLLSDHQK